jgi:hypothetical protein
MYVCRGHRQEVRSVYKRTQVKQQRKLVFLASVAPIALELTRVIFRQSMTILQMEPKCKKDR